MQLMQIEDSILRKQIPRGLKIGKRLTAVDPSPDLRFDHSGILAKAETEIMQATLEHYEDNIPKLKEQFDHYYSKTDELPPVDKRLLVLKLIHFKNSLTEEKAKSNQTKLERPDNRYLDQQGINPIANTNPNAQINQQPPLPTWLYPNDNTDSWGQNT